MSEFTAYFAKKHRELQVDYSPENPEEDCSHIAAILVHLLSESGSSARALAITGQRRDGIEFPILIPRAYEGRVQWGIHIVCESDGVVYDPMLTEPMQLDDYLAEAFEEPAVAEERDVSSLFNR